jgi:CheY-like chemotaxis protein
LIDNTKGPTMKASYPVANRLPAFSAVRHLSTREGNKEVDRPFFREGKSINQNNPLVCVIDDDSSIRESLSFLLRSAGLKVQTFCSAQEFLARPPRESVGCLVLDVQLPGISGLDLQQELANAPSFLLGVALWTSMFRRLVPQSIQLLLGRSCSAAILCHLSRRKQ